MYKNVLSLVVLSLVSMLIYSCTFSAESKLDSIEEKLNEKIGIDSLQNWASGLITKIDTNLVIENDELKSYWINYEINVDIPDEINEIFKGGAILSGTSLERKADPDKSDSFEKQTCIMLSKGYIGMFIGPKSFKSTWSGPKFGKESELFRQLAPGIYLFHFYK